MQNPEALPGRWWGEFPLPAGCMRRWRIGPLEFWAQRLAREWRMAWRSTGADQPCPAAVSEPAPIEALPEDMNVMRLSAQASGKPLLLVPALADRAVVVRPELPFVIPGGEAVTLFVSTPIWLRLALGDNSEPLLEIPVLRPPDTWFGADTRNGELCYATRMPAYTRMDEIERQSQRAVTPVHVRNDAPNALAIERLRVPVPLLTLGADAERQLWTQALTLERRTRSDEVSLQLGAMASPATQIVEPLGGPRRVESERVVRRALSRFFG